MVDITNYKQEIAKLLRDVLRGVDYLGNSNIYTSYIHHPSDYEVDRKTLKNESEWIDKRFWIIIGKKKKFDNTPVISIEPVDIGSINIDAQGSNEYDFTNGSWQIMVDTSSVKNNERSWRDRISASVLKTLAKNKNLILQNYNFVKLNFSTNDISSNDDFIDVIQVNIDGTLNE